MAAQGARQTQPSSGQGETFSLRLSSAVPAEELRGWFESAAVGERTVYATGVQLPRAADGVLLATRLKDQGQARLHNVRDPDDRRRWQFVVVKIAAAAARCRCSPAPRDADADADDLARLLALLRSCAQRNRACPSNANLAISLGLKGEKGRQRAAYLLRKLETIGQIAIAAQGTMRPRVVTILAPGRAKGRQTAAEQASG